ncbi:MAG TPA: hypothetical protein VGR78_00355 [Verrucomicrobiae bacterium]|nr:hypothetical protein [Verrucomicrobiae bacterium]
MLKKRIAALALASAQIAATAHAAENIRAASAVVSYHPGIDFAAGFTNATAALGEPSRNTPGQFGGPVDPFDPPYLTEQIVSIGVGGSLTLKFDSPISNNPANPFGLDFIIFGNNGFVITNGDFSGGGITDGSLFAQNTGSTRVSVSGDGTNFYQLTSSAAPVVDGFFPTDGPGDFSIPVDPSLNLLAFAGNNLDGIRNLYAGSGGGTAFDISWARDAQGQPVDLDSIQFVRIEVLSGTSEVDAVAAVAAGAGISPKLVEKPFDQWSVFGATNLFSENADSVHVTWDSSQTNSYFYLPLGLTLTRSDHFQLTFILRLEDIAIGTTPGKLSTFEIANGLINPTTAFDPQMFRGTGVDPVHGPRNLLELDYFPDSGFGATVSPTIVTHENEFGYSNNFPIELLTNVYYKFEMTFTPSDQTLRSRIWTTSDTNNFGPAQTLKDLSLSSSLSDFALTALAISSYSDAGQTSDFAGSIRANGTITAFQLTIFDRPSLGIKQSGNLISLSFETAAGQKYFVEGSADTLNWAEAGGPYKGTGAAVTIPIPHPERGYQIFRVRAQAP